MQPLENDDPARLGPFEVLRRLGAGGMGRVYLGTSSELGLAAVKVVHETLAAEAGFRARFRREVEAARRVSGPNTAPVVAADPDGDPAWLATQYIDGPTLQQRVDGEGALSRSATLRMGAEVAAALGGIHAAALVHRDLKPANVMLGETGARVIDFGIARAADASALTLTGRLAGSAGSLAPEQALGRSEITGAADVFALGVVLFFAITGRRLFGDGPAPTVMYRIVHDRADVTAVTDRGLRRLIEDCVAKEPGRRPVPATVAERCRTLLAVADQATVTDAPTLRRRAPWWTSRWLLAAGLPVAAAAGAVAAVLLLPTSGDDVSRVSGPVVTQTTTPAPPTTTSPTTTSPTTAPTTKPAKPEHTAKPTRRPATHTTTPHRAPRTTTTKPRTTTTTPRPTRTIPFPTISLPGGAD